ncbi:class I SAM-dependent methyltransferase [Alphaproteobacteria bacterium]|nr:class I SAM-dependent methyltransferase [Alphaproteobacteria bacterium]
MSYLDKNDIIKNIPEKSGAGFYLEFGCGSRKFREDSICIDLVDCDCVDIVGDVFSVFPDIPSESVDHIYSSHFVEHLNDIDCFMKESHRILKPSGQMTIIVPHFSNPYFYSDPTHKQLFGLYSMSYFARDKILSRAVPGYSRLDGLTLASVKLTFRSFRPRYIRHLIFKVIQVIVNVAPFSMELYEELFSGLIPCYQVEFLIEKDCSYYS